ncbi:hypothetical protein GlitD10_2386 [Gloeomargarita lithophora Alchichica-D10]|uniref:Uncharacterized protein n=1 Tax=Gloeomargarita lithophora Alchichica-D10 TaxID=1188229 RepID=A0A1J0AFN0_9CYAN|nr:hypothetical protein [Gloeomargarita lithophora]APB34720.1 hypothetical protein GlitD10_2386 [Gloeomargarita lithophora Alchichica-D10]
MSFSRNIVLMAALVGLTPAALVMASPMIVAQASAESLLNGMPRPKETSTAVSSLFAANAYQQKSINYQAKMKPETALKFFQSSLTSKGYVERPINTTSGQWGFSVVFDTPATVAMKSNTAGKKVVLVYQGTMLAPNTININARFEEI